MSSFRSPSGAAGVRRRAVSGLLGTVATLVAGQAVLWRAGALLPSLPLDRAGAARTVAEADPLALAVAMVRLLALGVGTGLLAVTVLGAAARCCGAARLVVHVDRWTPPSLRRLLDGALGVGLAASIGLGAAPAGVDAGHPPTPAATTIHRLPDAPATTLRRLPDSSAPATTPGMSLRRLPDAAPVPRAPPASVLAPATAPEASPLPAAAPSSAPSGTSPFAAQAEPPAAPGGPAEVVVRPGESFWLLAERHEADRLGRQPTQAEVGSCWQQMVALNRHRLAVPGDPDLLFPGQRLVVPCP